MRILHVDKFLRRAGGAAIYMLTTAARQEALGHEVEFFSMRDDRNLDATYEDEFPPFVVFDAPVGARGRAVAAGRMLWSPSAARGMARVVERFRPDVVHLHNIYHQLSPSILRPLAEARIPTVMTVHDAKLVCPTYLLLSNGEICEACVGGQVWHCTTRRCQGGSLAASALLTIESGAHRAARAYRHIARLITPSRFHADLLRRDRLYADRVRELVNPIDATAIERREGAGDGFVSIGRLDHQKGVDVAIRAIGVVEGATLTVAGDGPQRAEFERLAQDVAPGRVTFLGHVDAATVAGLNRSARAAVTVVQGHENMPLSVLETMAASVPLVVSRLGGLPEMVHDGTEGFVVPHDDVTAIAAAVRRLHTDPVLSVALGGAARVRVERDFAVGPHLDRLFELYAEAAQVARSRR